jgi:hypothetical protein
MAEFAEAHGIVMMSIGASPEDITEGRDWVFRYYLTSSGEANTAYSTLDSLNVDTLGILYLNDTYGRPVMEELAQMFESSGGVTEAVGFLSGATVFSSEVASLVDNEAIFTIALRHQIPTILSEIRARGYTGYVLTGVEGSIPEMWGSPDSQDVYVNAPVLYNPSAPVDTEFLSEFEDRFGEPLTHQGAVGADVLKLIWGLLSDTEVSRENLRDLLSQGFVSSGILGVVNVESGCRNVDIPLYRAVIEGGELRYL